MADQDLEREYQRILGVIDREHLVEHYPELAAIITHTPAWPSSLRDRQVQAAIAFVTKYERQKHNDPFLPVPASVLTTGRPIATQHDGRVICLPRRTHVLLIGPTKSGKTTLALHIIRSHRTAGVHVLAYDLKDDLRREVVNDPDYRIIDRSTPIAPLRPPSYADPGEHWVDFREWFLKSQYSGMLQANVLRQAGATLAKTPGTHSLAELQAAVRPLGSKTETYGKREAAAGIDYRLERVNEQFPGLFTTKDDGIPIEALLDSSLYFTTSTPDDISEWAFTYLGPNQAYRRNRNQQTRPDQASHLVVMDESFFSLSKEHATSRLSGANLMTALITVMGELGQILLATTTSFAGTDPLVIRNAGLIGVLPGTTEAPEIGRSLGWNKETIDFAQHRLMLGQAVLTFNTEYRHPILATFPPYDHDKAVTSEEWEAARSRTTALIPPPIIEDAPQKATGTPPGIKLSAAQERFLRRVATGPLTPTTDLYDELELLPQTGDRAKNFLIKIGFLQTTPVVIRSGRGGRATIPSPTPLGYEYLGMTPRRGSRGGGIAHSYYCQELVRLIPNAHQEVALPLTGGTKCVDVLFRYLPVCHPWFASFLATQVSRPDGELLRVGEELLVAIEVEVSDPLASAPRNATRDLDADVDVVLIAVHRDQREPVRTALQTHTETDYWPMIGIVDILELLDTLRKSTA